MIQQMEVTARKAYRNELDGLLTTLEDCAQLLSSHLRALGVFRDQLEPASGGLPLRAAELTLGVLLEYLRRVTGLVSAVRAGLAEEED